MKVSILVNVVLSIGLTKTGSIQQEPINCQIWGDGWQQKTGCGLCFSGFQKSLVSTSQAWSNTNRTEYLEIRYYQMVCNTNPCSRIPLFGMFTPPQIKDQTREFYLIDPVTRTETRLGCPTKGQFGTNDVYYVNDLVFYTEPMECKDMNCIRGLIYDTNQKKLIEVSRLINSDARLCKPSDDGLCAILRVIPSPSGSFIAVIVHDDNVKKSFSVEGSMPSDFTQNIIVHFLETRALLNGQVVKRTHEIMAKKGQFETILNFKWDPFESGIGFVATDPVELAIDFFLNDPPVISSCQNSTLKTCECRNEATKSGSFRYPDGLFINNFELINPTNAYNCGQ